MVAIFLDFFEVVFIIIPLLAPVADKLGIDLVWFGGPPVAANPSKLKIEIPANQYAAPRFGSSQN